jgi:uncharacterized BrkB/YihY/UPF0761 family membrane protein
LLLLFTAVFCAQVMVYDETWDTVDLEGQHEAAAAAAAAAPPTGFKAFQDKASKVLQAVKTKAAEAKGLPVFQREFWNRRRLLLVLLLLAVLVLALGLGVGLGTRHAAGGLQSLVPFYNLGMSKVYVVCLLYVLTSLSAPVVCCCCCWRCWRWSPQAGLGTKRPAGNTKD